MLNKERFFFFFNRVYTVRVWGYMFGYDYGCNKFSTKNRFVRSSSQVYLVVIFLERPTRDDRVVIIVID